MPRTMVSLADEESTRKYVVPQQHTYVYKKVTKVELLFIVVLLLHRGLLLYVDVFRFARAALLNSFL